MSFNYNKLLGKMREKKITQENLANKIGNSPVTLSLKLNNKARFKQAEISAICDILNIRDCEIGEYFFNTKV